MGNVSNKRCRENQNTHFMFSNFFSENRAVYEIMWKSVVVSFPVLCTYLLTCVISLQTPGDFQERNPPVADCPNQSTADFVINKLTLLRP